MSSFILYSPTLGFKARPDTSEAAIRTAGNILKASHPEHAIYLCEIRAEFISTYGVSLVGMEPASVPAPTGKEQ